MEPWCADCSKRTALIEPGGWGAMVLTTTGRRTGRARPVIVGYLEGGQNLITLAMNGWGEAEPAWWLNLQAHPDATARLVDGPRQVTARAAEDDEREHLWARFRTVAKNLDAYAACRPRQTVVSRSKAPGGVRVL